MADRQKETEEQVQDDKIRTPGDSIGEVETRNPEQIADAEPVVYPETTGTDTGQPTTLQRESPAGS